MNFGRFLAYLPTSIVQAIVASGSVIAFTRLLIPEEYGRYSLALVTSYLLQSCCFYWIQSGVSRMHEGALRDDRLDRLLSSSYAAFLAAALAASTLYLA